MLRGSVLAIDPFNPQRLVLGTNGRGFFVANWPRALSFTGTRAYVSTIADASFGVSANGQKNYDFDLTKLNERDFTTLTLPLGEGDFSAVQQVQLQGANLGANAQPLKLEIDSLGTTSP